MNTKEFLRRYVYVHKCVGCGEILDYKRSLSAFCETCVLDWNSSTVASCPQCSKPARECNCMPKLLAKAGALTERRLFFYESENSSSPTMRILFWLKYNKSQRIVNFVAEEMSLAIREESDTLSAAHNEVVISNIPRSRRARRAIGYDQSESIARRIARSMGFEYIRAFKSSSKTQKKLDLKERRKNAQNNITLYDVDVKGKYVVLIDDMVTTGASMSTCVKLLMGRGAVGVLCFSVASKNKM